MSVCTKAFSITIDNPCGASTDWCASPGACRLRVASFNAADWTFPWTGDLDGTLGSPVPPFLPCYSYEDSSGFVGLGYNVSAGHWQFTILCPDFSTYLAIGPVGPTGTSPLGSYARDGASDPACFGPATFVIQTKP